MRLFAPFATYFQQSLHHPFNSSDDQKLLYWNGIDVAQAKLRELEDESSHRGHRDSGLALFRYIIQLGSTFLLVGLGVMYLLF